MLLIERIYETNNLKIDYVRCPVCKQGRLCDKPVGDKVMVIAVSEGTGHQTGNRIILKCPKCGQRFIITMIGAKQITAVPFREVSACRPHSFLHGNVPGEWYSVFKISVMGFSNLHIVPSPKGFQQGLVVLLLLHY